VQEALNAFAEARTTTRAAYLQAARADSAAKALRGASDTAALAVLGMQYESGHFGSLIRECSTYE